MHVYQVENMCLQLNGTEALNLYSLLSIAVNTPVTLDRPSLDFAFGLLEYMARAWPWLAQQYAVVGDTQHDGTQSRLRSVPDVLPYGSTVHNGQSDDNR